MPLNYSLLSQLAPQPASNVIATAPPPPAPSGGGGPGDILSSIMGGFGGGKGGGGGGGDAPAPVQAPSGPPAQFNGGGGSPAPSPASMPDMGPQMGPSGGPVPQMQNLVGQNPAQAMPTSGGSPQGMSQYSNVGGVQQTNAGPGTIPDSLKNSEAYQASLQAYQNARSTGITKSPIMTVVDFSKPASEKRMFIVDTQKNQLLKSTWVAQGSGKGFSNTPNSHTSSLGSYITGAPYTGKHGPSLRVQGLDKGINDNAASRDIVVHGSNYIGDGKTGQSWGCFAVPQNEAADIGKTLEGGTFIHAWAPNSPASSRTTSNFMTNPAMGKQVLSSPYNNPFNVQLDHSSGQPRINPDNKPMNLNQSIGQAFNPNRPQAQMPANPMQMASGFGEGQTGSMGQPSPMSQASPMGGMMPTGGQQGVMQLGQHHIQDSPTKFASSFSGNNSQPGLINTLGSETSNNEAFSGADQTSRKDSQQNMSPLSGNSQAERPEISDIKNGISYVESREAKDPYTLRSKASPNGDRAYGKYQVMGNNIPSWSKEATGKKMTPEEFMANPQAQEEIASYHLGKIYDKYKDPNQVASVWFTGRPIEKAGNAKDAYGTTNAQYQKVFNKGRTMGNSSLRPSTSLNDDQPLIPGYQRIPTNIPVQAPPGSQRLANDGGMWNLLHTIGGQQGGLFS